MNRPALLRPALLAVVACAPALSLAAPNDPPVVEHQPAQCTLADKPIELCASVFDDGDIARVRVYYGKPDDKTFYVTDMAFEGARFCGTIPAIRAGKLSILGYYIQAIDTEYESKRTSTYQLRIQDEMECPFPAVQKDPAKAQDIKMFATSSKQGSKLPDYIDPTGVTFIPVPKR